MRRSRSVLVLAATMAIGGSPGLAHAAAGWTKISTDDKSSIDSPSLAMAGSQAVAAFPRGNNGIWDAATDASNPAADVDPTTTAPRDPDATFGPVYLDPADGAANRLAATHGRAAAHPAPACSHQRATHARDPPPIGRRARDLLRGWAQRR